MGEPFVGTAPSDRPLEDRLDSWKEIAAYLGRDVTTVQRWEKREGMPVYRHQHDRMGSVYASRAELEAWTRSRSLRAAQDDSNKVASLIPPDTDTATGMSDRVGEENSPERVRESALLPLPRSVTWKMLLLAVAALVALLAVILVRYRSTHPGQPAIKSIAVLPLKNLSGDPTQEYLADGMTEALIGRLSGIHGLRVISHTSVMQLKDTKLSVPEIAKTLNVDAVVEGSVMRDGNRIRVHAQLIRAATDEHFWSEEYDRELPDVLSLESDVAQSIANKVEVTLTGQERSLLAAARPVVPEAYESYLKGMAHGDTKADVEKSIADFEEAIRQDPTFARAYLGLAAADSGLGTIIVGGSPTETRPKVISAARKALELDPTLAEAHALLAGTYQEQWKWAEAEAEYKRALDLNPNDAGANSGFGDWLLSQGRTEEAIAWSRRGDEIDPLDASGGTAFILFNSRRYDDAIRELRVVLTVHPESVEANFILGYALIGNGQSEEAIPVLERTVLLTEHSPATIGLLATAYAHAGRRDDALRLLNELKRRRETCYVPAAAFLNPYLALGDYDEAFIWFERAYQEQSNIMQLLKVYPFFDPVRNDPRFVDLVRRVGLSQ